MTSRIGSKPHVNEYNLFSGPPEKAITTCDSSLCYISHLDVREGAEGDGEREEREDRGGGYEGSC